MARVENERMQEIRRGVEIGKRVNLCVSSAVETIEEEIDDLIEVFKSGLNHVERIKNRVQCLKAQLVANDNLMNGFSESLGPKEDGFSNDLLLEVDNSLMSL